MPRPGYAPGPRGLYPDTSGVFEGTPYEIAPPDLQRQVITGAQMRLARQGYYRSEIDGIYGPGMEAALRAFQSRDGSGADWRTRHGDAGRAATSCRVRIAVEWGRVRAGQ